MKTIKIIIFSVLISFNFNAYTQVAINADGSLPDSSAMLDVKSFNKGVLPPRLTNMQRDAISSPAESLIIYNIDEQEIQYFNGTMWKTFSLSDCTPQQPVNIFGITYPECNQLGVIYTIDEVTWATSYHWTVPADATIASGQGTTSITIDFGTTSGNVSVRAESGCGNSIFKDLAITIGIPDQPGDIAGNILPEPNATGEVYSIDSVNGATSYNWTVPQNSTIINGQGTTSITVDFDTIPGNISVRAENSCGNSDYSNLATTFFTCGDQYTDTRDGKTYNTISIGNQCWFAENLNIGVMINNYPSNNGIIEKYCYNDDTTNCNTYGGLYRWYEMMQYVTTEGTQGICPDGWHIPTDDEWKTLEVTLGMSQNQADSIGIRGTDEGKKLKSTSGWNNNGNGTNSSGFNGLPGGDRFVGGFGNPYLNIGHFGIWWTSSGVWYRDLSCDYDKVKRNNDISPDYGFSVRCLKD